MAPKKKRGAQKGDSDRKQEKEDGSAMSDGEYDIWGSFFNCDDFHRSNGDWPQRNCGADACPGAPRHHSPPHSRVNTTQHHSSQPGAAIRRRPGCRAPMWLVQASPLSLPTTHSHSCATTCSARHISLSRTDVHVCASLQVHQHMAGWVGWVRVVV